MRTVGLNGVWRGMLVAALVVGFAATTAAHQGQTAVQGQQTGPGTGGSPHWKADWTIHGAKITIEYGRPYLKGRPESQMMPAGQPWRTGADQPTLITSDKPLAFGTLKLAPGTYTINTQPGPTWQLIIGKYSGPGQWGIPYKPELEIGRTPMTLGKTKSSVEQLAISIDSTTAGGTLRIEWGTTSVSAPFTVG